MENGTAAVATQNTAKSFSHKGASNMDQGEMERVRELAQALVQRLKNDAAFRQQVQENPVTTLTAAGLPDVAVSAFLQHIEPDVVGYMTYGECAITRAWP